MSQMTSPSSTQTDDLCQHCGSNDGVMVICVDCVCDGPHE